ncbi:MAG: hypothetical protein AAGM22_11215 [Acidobacteriota bacterium]
MTDTSSIGPGWPPAVSSCHRIKGIDTRGVIRESAQLGALLDSLEAESERLNHPDDGGCDRLSLRALCDESVIARSLPRIEPWAEAVLPLDDGSGRLLVYFGRNAGSRPCDAADLDRALANVEIAEQRDVEKAAAMLRRVSDGGYGLRILTADERRGSEEVLLGVADLYRRFGWNRDETRDILQNPGSLIAVASTGGPGRRGEEIVCAGIAELSHLEFGDGEELRMAEFTEAATLSTHQGRGLYSGVAATLMLELARRSAGQDLLGGELDLGFGECSGHDLGVLIAARRLGRRFARTASKQRAWPVRGFLPQHVPIAGAPRSTRYNDLFPTYFSRQTLYRFAESRSAV